jgi:hypothetical protein
MKVISMWSESEKNQSEFRESGVILKVEKNED